MTIVDAVAKIPQKCLKHNAADQLASTVAGDNYGAKACDGGTDIGHLHVRAYVDIADVNSLCLSLCLVDVATAFASLLRCLFVPHVQSIPLWTDKLLAVGFSTAAVDGVI